MGDGLRTHLLGLETALARRDPFATGGTLAELVADDFVEFGASGRTWDADDIRDLLSSAEPNDEVLVEDFEIARLAPDVVLVTYRLGAPRPANCSSIWVRRAGRWVIRFHQGTLRPDDR